MCVHARRVRAVVMCRPGGPLPRLLGHNAHKRMFVMLKPITNYGFPHSLTARTENSVARGRPVVRPNIGANIGVVFIIREHNMLISSRADRSADLSSRVRALTTAPVLSAPAQAAPFVPFGSYFHFSRCARLHSPLRSPIEAIFPVSSCALS